MPSGVDVSMSEQLLLCHGSPIPDSNFELPSGFTIFYIGIPGKPLLVSKAEQILSALKSDPSNIEEVARSLDLVVESIEGPQVTGPNFTLKGDSELPTQLYNLIGGETVKLDDDWETRLSTQVAEINQQPGPHNLFLLCCWKVEPV